MGVRVDLDTTRLDTILRRMPTERDDALGDAGEDLEAMVKAEVRAMGVVDTERLLDSVEWRPNTSAGGDVSYGVVVVPAKSDAGFPYPIAQHEGWTDRGGGWHAGRPFMRSAVEKFKKYFRENYFGRLFD
jgi:hypothetical protein